MIRTLSSTVLALGAALAAPRALANDTCAVAQYITATPGAWHILINRIMTPLNVVDFYRTSVEPGVRVDFKAWFSPAEVDIDLRMWNPDCSVLLAESHGSTDEEEVTWLNTTGVTQEVRCEVYAVVPPSGTVLYNFGVHVDLEDCSVDDDWEPNDDCAHPHVIPFDYYESEPDRVVQQGDDDYYRITVPAYTAPRIFIGYDFAAGDVDAQLYDADCSTLLETSATNGSEHLTLDNFSPTPRTFVVRVYLADAAPCNSYFFYLTSGAGHDYCTSAPNSSGHAAVMDSHGSASVSANDLELQARWVPTNTLGIFFYGPQAASVPFGNGTRCVGGAVVRSPVFAYFKGLLIWNVDYAQLAGTAFPVLPGATYNFQCWFRDPAAGGSNFDLSDGYRIAFTP